MDNHASLPTQQNQHLPVYNIKAVSRLVGLLPVTLRAWERRYGLPRPSRGEQGYRLYSEYDLNVLRWLKKQIDSGLNIGRAVEYLHELRSIGRDPVVNWFVPREEKPVSINVLSRELLTALKSFDESTAIETMRRAFAIYAVDQVLIEIIQPVLVELGEQWHRGELPIAVEHYATQFCMQNLMSMLTASAPPSRQGVIIAACAPGELHQIGLLMLVVMLRWRGWDVKYLGQDLSLERLEEALMPVRPRMLLFTATRKEAAMRLLSLPDVLRKLPEPHPLVLLGGQAFKDTQLPESIPAIYLESSPTETVETIERLMIENPSSS
jgi:MerR family transcriptional regulator, light-induced transcriptional regulator